MLLAAESPITAAAVEALVRSEQEAVCPTTEGQVAAPDLASFDVLLTETLFGCTTDYVAMLARDGGIPPSCLVKGTGNGKPWKFHRSQIDAWIDSR